jgi:hypothetical protein
VVLETARPSYDPPTPGYSVASLTPAGGILETSASEYIECLAESRVQQKSSGAVGHDPPDYAPDPADTMISFQ